MDIDGEYFVHKTRDRDGEPRIQLIESHRIGDQRGSNETIDGVGVDAGREAQQNRADVEMGLKTLSDHFNEQGADFGEEVERRAADAKLILDTAAKHGIPVEMLWKPGGG